MSNAFVDIFLWYICIGLMCAWKAQGHHILHVYVRFFENKKTWPKLEQDIYSLNI